MKRYHIYLHPDERQELEDITAKQKVNAQKKLRAFILLRADESKTGPHLTDEAIAAKLPVSVRTVEHLRERTCDVGPVAALERRPNTRVCERKLDGRAEARLITIAKEQPPEGHARWTMQLLANQLVRLGVVDSIDDNTVWRTLKKTNFVHT